MSKIVGVVSLVCLTLLVPVLATGEANARCSGFARGLPLAESNCGHFGIMRVGMNLRLGGTERPRTGSFSETRDFIGHAQFGNMWNRGPMLGDGGSVYLAFDGDDVRIGFLWHRRWWINRILSGEFAAGPLVYGGRTALGLVTSGSISLADWVMVNVQYQIVPYQHSGWSGNDYRMQDGTFKELSMGMSFGSYAVFIPPVIGLIALIVSKPRLGPGF